MRANRTVILVVAVLGIFAACDDGARGPDGSTSLQVQGAVDSCPTIKSIMVSPATAPVGESVLATVVATDRDRADQLRFSWSAAAGTFSDAGAAATLYRCATAGRPVLMVKVSDGRCDSEISIVVRCGAEAGEGSAAAAADAAHD